MRRGDPAGALTTLDAALHALALHHGGRIPAPTGAAKGRRPDWDLARLISANRAVALAALGRADDAWAEVEWAKGFADDGTVYRVLLETKLAARDDAGAADVAAARPPSFSLFSREEVLGDVACFVGRADARTRAEATRLSIELRRDPRLKAWMEGMAPGLAGEFERSAVAVQAGLGP